MVYKDVLCLANSKKHSGRCIAGRLISGGSPGIWIRPVSARPGEEVSEYERQYENGQDPQVLDIVSVPLIKAVPHGCQTENWLLEPNEYWVRRGQADRATLVPFLETPASLWVNGHSTYNGFNDEIPDAIATGLPNSLYLIRVTDLELRVFVSGAAFGNGKRRVQGRFTYQGTAYWLWVTDPVIEREYLARADGEYAVGPSLLTISIGEPFAKGGANPGTFRYKLIASVIC